MVNIKRLFTVAAATTLLATPALAQTTFTAAQRQQISRQAELVRDGLDEVLRDYPTARFRDVSARLSLEEPNVKPQFCGYVNSKNAMGAYVGWDRFITMGSTVKLESADPMYVSLCDGGGRASDGRDYSSELTFR